MHDLALAAVHFGQLHIPQKVHASMFSQKQLWYYMWYYKDCYTEKLGGLMDGLYTSMQYTAKNTHVQGKVSMH